MVRLKVMLIKKIGMKEISGLGVGIRLKRLFCYIRIVRLKVVFIESRKFKLVIIGIKIEWKIRKSSRMVRFIMMVR